MIVVLDPTCGSGTTAFCAEKSRPAMDHLRHFTSGCQRRAADECSSGRSSPHYVTAKRRQYLRAASATRCSNRITLMGTFSLRQGKPEQVDPHRSARFPMRAPSAYADPLRSMTLGRYSVEDWKGYVVRERPDGAYDGGAAKPRELHRGDLPPLPQVRGDPGGHRTIACGGRDREGRNSRSRSAPSRAG